MNLVTHDDDIKWFNASLIKTLNDYGVMLPSVQSHTKLVAPTEMLDTVINSIAQDLGRTSQVQAALTCLDTSQGCWICHDRSQSRYDWCASGCQVCNSCQGCNECQICNTTCNTGEAQEDCDTIYTWCGAYYNAYDELPEPDVDHTQHNIGNCGAKYMTCGQKYVDENSDWCIQAFAGGQETAVCYPECYGCDTDCNICDSSCVGTQTCSGCNAGQACLNGCYKDYAPGCSACHGGTVDNCASDYYPGCGRAESVIECHSACNTGCVQNDTDTCNESHGVTRCDIYCQSNDAPGYIHGCNGNNTPCTNKFINDGACNMSYTQSPYDSSCGLSQLENQCYQGFQSRVCTTSDGCLSMCVSHVTPSNCKSAYRNCNTLADGIVSCTSSYVTCGTDEGINCSGTFKNQNGGNPTSCQGSYKTDTQNTTSCRSHYSDSTTDCQLGYNSNGSQVYCREQYSGDGVYCEKQYGSHGDNTCISNYSCGAGNSCAEGYNGDSCKRGYSMGGTVCPNDYNNTVVTCTVCNTGSNSVCVSCVGGQGESCPTCYGTGNTANCTGGCVAGEGATCTECVSGGFVGCMDCQSCDSGCNNEVTCSRYGNGWCYAAFADTSCGHVVNNCSSNYNTSGPACRSCNTCQGCQGTCDASCQNCQGAACQTCQTICESTCQGCDTSCQTCQTACESSCQSACESSCLDCQGQCQAGCDGFCNTAEDSD